MSARLLVAGIGNIFLGDDAFGVEVVRKLRSRPLPSAVRVIDFGIRGVDLTYAILDGYETVLLIDATPRGGMPGTLYVIEPEVPPPDPENRHLVLETHALDPAKVLRLAAALGGTVPRLVLVGCEPEALGSEDDMLMGLSDSVARAVDEAVVLVEELIVKLLSSPAAHEVSRGGVALNKEVVR